MGEELVAVVTIQGLLSDSNVLQLDNPTLNKPSLNFSRNLMEMRADFLNNRSKLG